MADQTFENATLATRASQISRQVLVASAAHSIGTVVSDTIEWPDNPEGLGFIFTGNTGAGATTTYTLEGSIDNSTWMPLKTDTITGDVAASERNIFNAMTNKTSSTTTESIPFSYYRVSSSVVGATHTWALEAFSKDY